MKEVHNDEYDYNRLLDRGMRARHANYEIISSMKQFFYFAHIYKFRKAYSKPIFINAFSYVVA